MCHGIYVYWSPSPAVLLLLAITVVVRFHVVALTACGGSLCCVHQGTYCSNNCGAKADPAAVQCCVCGSAITGKYIQETLGPMKGKPRHPQCVLTRSAMTSKRLS